MLFIGPWYWRLFKDKRRQRQMERTCLNIWRFVLGIVQGLALSFRLGLENSIHPFWSSLSGVTDPPQLDKGGGSIQGLHWSFIIQVGITFRFLLNVSWQLLSHPQLLYCLLLLDIIKVPILSLHCDVLWNVFKVVDEMSMRIHTACESYKSM